MVFGDLKIFTHLTGLGSCLELGLSGSLGGPSLLEERLWDGDLLEKLVINSWPVTALVPIIPSIHPFIVRPPHAYAPLLCTDPLHPLLCSVFTANQYSPPGMGRWSMEPFLSKV